MPNTKPRSSAARGWIRRVLAVVGLGDDGSPAERRRGDRTSVEAIGLMDGVVVRIVDLSPGGVGLLSPHAVTPGRVVDVRAELPTMGDGARPTRLQMTVTSCATHRDADASGAAARVWRIGGTVSTRNDADHDSLVEFSHVLALCSRRSVSAPQPSVTAPVAAESDLREAVGVAG